MRKRIFRIAMASAIIMFSTSSCTLLLGDSNWNCSARGGSYEKHSRSVLMGPKTVSGEIFFDSADFSTPFTASASLTFGTSKGDCAGCAGLRFYQYQDYPGKIYAELLIGGYRSGGVWLLHVRPTPFTMKIYEDGTLHVDIGRHGLQMTDKAINYERMYLNSSCTSSSVEFRNVEVSRLKN